jgi:GTP-binding protein
VSPAASATEDADSDALEAGRRLFTKPATFIRGIADLAQLPEADLPEVAFAGRSNVGKSSLINALTGHGQLARTSHTPGRTQQINLFDLGGRLILADLPGYGFARAPKPLVEGWNRLFRDYLRGRSVLRLACVLIDARHGLKDNDRDFLGMLGDAAVAYRVVLTKLDELRAPARDEILWATAEAIRRLPGAQLNVLATSARDGRGIAELRAVLAGLARDAELD